MTSNTLRRDAILEANRPGHICGSYYRPCIHHASLHCLACCIAAGQKKKTPASQSEGLFHDTKDQQLL